MWFDIGLCTEHKPEPVISLFFLFPSDKDWWSVHVAVCTEEDLLSVHSFSGRSGTKIVGVNIVPGIPLYNLCKRNYPFFSCGHVRLRELMGYQRPCSKSLPELGAGKALTTREGSLWVTVGPQDLRK